MTKKPRCAECRKVATHLLLPQHIDLCQAHYRLRRPYTVLAAAFNSMADLLTPAERTSWEAFLWEAAEDGEPPCRCQPPVLVEHGQEVRWWDYLTARREVRLATAAGQLELVAPRTLAIARRSWPAFVHTCSTAGS